MEAIQTYQFEYLPLGLYFCYEFSGKSRDQNTKTEKKKSKEKTTKTVLLNIPNWYGKKNG